MQDRAKLLWSYNKELQTQIQTKFESFSKTSEKDEVEIRNKVYEINRLNNKIEDLTKENKEKETLRVQMQEKFQREVKDINTRHLAEVENKNQEISALNENLEDIQNWLLIETDKEEERANLQQNLDGII